MKKTLLVIAILIIPILSFSQSGIGIRGVFGYSGGTFGGGALSYQNIGKFEINGAWNSNGYGLSALKLFELVDADALTFYTGIGAGGATTDFNSFQAAIIGDIGMSILFGPVQLSIDWRPEYEIVNPDSYPWRFNFGFAVRFMFPERG